MADMKKLGVTRRKAATGGLYGGLDPREMPAYDTFRASRYLRIPEKTIRNWAFGYAYPSGRTEPLIEVADEQRYLFSFANLIELHVLGALRRDHNVPLKQIRHAIVYLQKKLHSRRPLLEQQMETDGTNVFVSELGTLINASQDGQLAMQALLQAHLKRIDRDAYGVPVRLFPFTRSTTDPSAAPRLIAIDPAVAFGRPVIAGSRVPTVEVFERFRAGEQPDELAKDFGRSQAEIWEAIRCESQEAA